MFPHDFSFASDVETRRTLDLTARTSIAWTRVHAIIHQSTCWKKRLSGLDRGLTWRHVATRGSPIFISVKAARSPSDGHDKRRFSSHRGRRGISQSSSHGHDDPRSLSHLGDTWKRAGRLDLHRTDDDRASAGLIGDDRDHHLPDHDRTSERLRGRIPRSRFDRDAIVAKINRDHGSFITESSPRSWNDV